MQKISAVVIGYNEEKKVGCCLASLKKVADEIIFVDSFSTDKTLAIVKQYTKKVYKKKFNGYVEQKNFALSKASYNWVLSLDCDEELSEQLTDSLRKWKQAPADEHYIAFSMNRRTFYIYRWIYHSGWYPDRKIRFFNKKHLQWQGDKIHEILDCPKHQQGVLSGDILHYSFDSIADHLKTIQNFSEIAAHEAFAKGKKSSLPTIFFRSLWVGFRKIFVDLAFLDGVAGIMITYYSMVATWSKYSKLYILHLQKKQATSHSQNNVSQAATQYATQNVKKYKRKK